MPAEVMLIAGGEGIPPWPFGALSRKRLKVTPRPSDKALREVNSLSFLRRADLCNGSETNLPITSRSGPIRAARLERRSPGS
jgi:hypothetical protein